MASETAAAFVQPIGRRTRPARRAPCGRSARWRAPTTPSSCLPGHIPGRARWSPLVRHVDLGAGSGRVPAGAAIRAALVLDGLAAGDRELHGRGVRPSVRRAGHRRHARRRAVEPDDSAARPRRGVARPVDGGELHQGLALGGHRDTSSRPPPSSRRRRSRSASDRAPRCSRRASVRAGRGGVQSDSGRRRRSRTAMSGQGFQMCGRPGRSGHARAPVQRGKDAAREVASANSRGEGHGVPPGVERGARMLGDVGRAPDAISRMRASHPWRDVGLRCAPGGRAASRRPRQRAPASSVRSHPSRTRRSGSAPRARIRRARRTAAWPTAGRRAPPG